MNNYTGPFAKLVYNKLFLKLSSVDLGLYTSADKSSFIYRLKVVD